MAKGRLITFLFLLASCQFALTTSTSAPELTVVGGLPAPPGYSCIGEEVTLRCTWNPDEVLLGGWDVNGTLHALQELVALEGHTATTAKDQVNLFITSSRTSNTTYRCAVNLHNDSSVTLRSTPTIVKYDGSRVDLTITPTRIRSNDALSVTVRVQHRGSGCTDPIDTVMVSINNTEGNNCTRNVVSNGQDLQPCEFGGLQNRPYNITTMTRPNGGSFSVYPEQFISMPNEDGTHRGHTESTNKMLIIGVCIVVAVLLVMILVSCAVICICLYLRSRKDCCPLKSYDKPSRDSPPPSNPVQSEQSLQRTSESSDTSEAYSSDPLMHQISNEPADQVNNKDVYEQPNIPPSVPARVSPPTAQPLVPPRAPIDPNAVQYAELDHSGPRPIKPPPLENVRYVRIEQHRKNFAPHVQPSTAPATAVQGAANV